MYINLSEIMENLLQQHYEYLNKKDELVAYDYYEIGRASCRERV